MMENEELTKKLLDQEYDLEDLKTTTKQSGDRKRQGLPCWCKCVTITVVVFVVMSLMMTTCMYMWISWGVKELTVTTPHEPFPTVDIDEANLRVIKDRMVLFVDELIAGTAHDDMVITQDEINGFIGHSDYLRGNMMVSLEDGVIREQYSLPTYMLPGGKGRYFVGSDYLQMDDEHIEVEMETAATHEDWFDGPLLFAQIQYLMEQEDDGKKVLEMFLQKGSWFGQEAPQDFIDQRKNLMEHIYEDLDCDHARAILQGVDSVSIEEGQIVVKPRMN